MISQYGSSAGIGYGQQIGSAANIAPPTAGLRAIDRLSETCQRLHNAVEMARRSADAINGQVPQDPSVEAKNPTVTIGSLCDSMSILVNNLEAQLERISIGIGC